MRRGSYRYKTLTADTRSRRQMGGQRSPEDFHGTACPCSRCADTYQGVPLIRFTDRQRQVLQAITAYQREHGYAPTLRDLGELLGIKSSNGVEDHLKALERKGAIRRDPLKARTIRVLIDVGAA